jgi:hypothetical protein
MRQARRAADLTIHDGSYRGFEWFWADDQTMPGLDVFERIAIRDQDDFIASVVNWSNTPAGLKPPVSRVNIENKNPVIIAIKAGKHRFTAFREESGPTWIVYGHYAKEGQKRDKTGDRVIENTKKARDRYFERVKVGTYYDRR